MFKRLSQWWRETSDPLAGPNGPYAVLAILAKLPDNESRQRFIDELRKGNNG